MHENKMKRHYLHTHLIVHIFKSDEVEYPVQEMPRNAKPPVDGFNRYVSWKSIRTVCTPCFVSIDEYSQTKT